MKRQPGKNKLVNSDEETDKKKTNKREKKKTVFILKKTMRKQAKFFQNVLKEPFVLKKSRETSYLDCPAMGNYMATDNRIPMGEVGYIKQVKDYVIQSKKYEGIPKVDKKEVTYFQYNPNLVVGQVFENCYEVDLKHAYWEIANKVGLLKPDIYVKADTINPATGTPYIGRDTRLACIGALARKRKIYKFDGKKTTITRERSPITRHIWDYISLQISKVMVRASKAVKNDFIFFWSDAIFVTDKASMQEVSKIFDNANRQYKVRKIKSIEIVKSKTIKYISVDDDEEIRDFPYAFK